MPAAKLEKPFNTWNHRSVANGTVLPKPKFERPENVMNASSCKKCKADKNKDTFLYIHKLQANFNSLVG